MNYNLGRKKQSLLIAAWVALILYISLITLLSLATFEQEVSVEIPHMDKVVHCCFYLGLNALLLNLVWWWRKELKAKHIVVSTLLSVGYSLLIEVVQPLFGRDADPWDLLANTTGALLGIVAFITIGVRLNRFIEKKYERGRF
ncbi:MAG: VanZ family protein [Rikenellaceae bacterium]